MLTYRRIAARSGNLLGSLLLLASLGAAQTQKPAEEVSSEEAPATFRTRVNLVLVPVVVRDSKGRVLGTLTKENFQLFDKGKAQVISRFSVERSDRPRGVAKEKPTDSSTGKPLDQAAPGLVPESFVAYMFDDLHDSHADLVHSRVAAEKHLRALSPSSRAAIYTTSGQNMQDFTDDHEKLFQALQKLHPQAEAMRGGFQCPDIDFYMADLVLNKFDQRALGMLISETMLCMSSGDAKAGTMDATTAETIVKTTARRVLSEGEQHTRIALSVLRDAVRRMSALPGQRSIVLVSPGFLITDQQGEESDIIDRAIRANITINAVDARGLFVIVPGGEASEQGPRMVEFAALRDSYRMDSAMHQNGVLAELAAGTGGTFFHNDNDLLAGLNRVATPPEFYYVLGFSPQNLKIDGKYHVLKVSLVDPAGGKEMKSLAAAARRGYYAPKHLADAVEQTKEEIREALFSREDLDEIPVDLQTQFFKLDNVKARLAVVAKLDLRRLQFQDAGERHNNTLTIVSGVFDRNGNMLDCTQKKIEMKLRDATLARLRANGLVVKTSFNVLPGGYVIRLVVRDSEGQTMAAHNSAIEIP